MNLIIDPWIPVIRKDGSSDTIMPWQIAEAQNPVIEINAPRPDFQGALYQFLIGLLQTCFAPEDEDEWLDYWKKPPEPKELMNTFGKAKDVFELYNPDGPAFMQDFDLPGGEFKKIVALLIEAPGGKTIKDNLDHFVKRDQINGLCSSCVATALFTLQTNAPSGGVGHRVGLRGGGPLTTLVLSEKSEDALWKKLWLNVFSQDELAGAKQIDSSVMPWLGLTRVSDKKGVTTTPGDVHALQMYWGMPRRIRLKENEGCGTCDFCGKLSTPLYKEYRAQNYGTNYDGPWVHPLTPYRFDSKKEKIPLSIKGQKGGLGYRHWLGLTLQDAEMGNKAATIVQFFNDERGQSLYNGHSTSLWCFGYDMDNMKARCWYDSHFPIFALNDKQRINLVDWVGELISAAREVVKILRAQVKDAWVRRPGDAKGDMSIIDQQFWEKTEPDFYRLLDKLAKLPVETRMAPPKIYLGWFKVLEKFVFQIFEKATLESTPEDLDLKQIISAQQTLRKKFYGNKSIKNLKAKSTHEEEA